MLQHLRRRDNILNKVRTAKTIKVITVKIVMTDLKEAGTIVAADAIIIITEWNNKINKREAVP